MPRIIDAAGERETSEQVLDDLRKAAAAEWEVFWAGLAWRPIAEYDHRQRDAVVLLRSGQEWTTGYWGVAEGDSDETWRHAQESIDETALHFAPTEYAEVDDPWREALLAD